MSGDYLHGQASEFDNKTTGRWSREEHEKFIEGKFYFWVSNVCSDEHLRQGLEESWIAHRVEEWSPDQESRLEVLQPHREGAGSGCGHLHLVKGVGPICEGVSAIKQGWNPWDLDAEEQSDDKRSGALIGSGSLHESHVRPASRESLPSPRRCGLPVGRRT